MIDFRVSPEVASDLEEIWDFIAKDNQAAANQCIAQILEVFKRLVDMPRMGRQRDDLSAGLRSYSHGSYVITYRIRGEYIEIGRVVHGARNLYAIYHRDN